MKYQYDKVNDWHTLVMDEPVSYIVITHLYVEHGLDYLIWKNCKLKKKIFADHRSYSFSVKLDLCYEMNLIEYPLYENIRTLNALRNKMVHNLEINYKDLKLYLTSMSGEKMLHLADVFSMKDQNSAIRLMINLVGQKTITPLNTLMILRYGKEDKLRQTY